MIKNCPDVLSSSSIISQEDNLVISITPMIKRWVYCGLHDDNPPIHLCLQVDDKPSLTTDMSFDIDSIVGYATSLMIVREGIHWNSTQM
jgi:hypothetical protein